MYCGMIAKCPPLILSNIVITRITNVLKRKFRTERKYYRSLGVEALEMSSQLGLGTGCSCGIDCQRQLEERVASVLEVIVAQGFYAGQGL